ncbi:hypothetical protein Bca4012_101461 [Brassica carinata]
MGIDESLPSDPSILPSHPSDRVFAGFWAHFVDGKSVASLEEAFQKSSKNRYFFGGENIGFLDIACGAVAFSGVKFLSEDTTPGMLQWADKFGAHEAEKPYLPTVTEFLEFTKKKFNVQ